VGKNKYVILGKTYNCIGSLIINEIHNKELSGRELDIILDKIYGEVYKLYDITKHTAIEEGKSMWIEHILDR